MTMTRLSLALLLTLALTPACEGANPDYVPTPPPDAGPAALLLAPAPPVATGGTLDRSTRVFTTDRTQDWCLSTKPTSCVLWTVPLPPAPPGYDREITVTNPIIGLRGGPVIFQRCFEELASELLIYDDVHPDFRVLPPGVPQIVSGGPDLLTVAACARGAARVQVGDLVAALRFVPAAP